MAIHRVTVILTTLPGQGYASDQHVFLRPAGQEGDPATPYAIYEAKDREYRVLRDGSPDTGVRLSVMTAS